MTELAMVLPFDLQLQFWRAAWAGDVVEFDALVAEHPDWHEQPNGAPIWDRDAGHLQQIERWHGDRRLPTPEWWALPWVTHAEMEREIRVLQIWREQVEMLES